MIKLLKLGKSSFTLFEALISIFILSIVIVSFSKNSFYNNFDEEYLLLNSIENAFTLDSYDKNFISNNKKITIIKNDTLEENLLVKQIVYKNENIQLLKYKLIND